VLVWLSVWSEVQTVCHCIPKPHHLLPHLNPDWFYLSDLPEETFTHSHPSWLSDILYQFPPSATIHSIVCVQFMYLTDLFDNLFPGPLWSSSLSWPSTSYSKQFFTQSNTIQICWFMSAVGLQEARCVHRDSDAIASHCRRLLDNGSWPQLPDHRHDEQPVQLHWRQPGTTQPHNLCWTRNQYSPTNYVLSCLQCFDAVGWAAGRASGSCCYLLTAQVLVCVAGGRVFPGGCG